MRIVQMPDGVPFIRSGRRGFGIYALRTRNGVRQIITYRTDREGRPVPPDDTIARDFGFRSIEITDAAYYSFDVIPYYPWVGAPSDAPVGIALLDSSGRICMRNEQWGDYVWQELTEAGAWSGLTRAPHHSRVLVEYRGPLLGITNGEERYRAIRSRTVPDPAPCPHCERTIDHINSISFDGGCTSCRIICDCGERTDAEDYFRADGDGSQYWSCPACRNECDGCTTPVSTRASWRVCNECITRCRACSTIIHPDAADEGHDRCEECRIERVGGYGRTRPSMWLGGPVRARGGYYIGFELEISAENGDRSNVAPILDWAEANMGARHALECKSDSSVSGFEIASQPMTPEFFESLDWDSFFEVLDEHYPTWDNHASREPSQHGLHVHIGKVAFNGRTPIGAYSYLLGQGEHMWRIARREPYSYCERVDKPVSAAISASSEYGPQLNRIRGAGIYHGRTAINLTNPGTVELRAFRSTRIASELRDAVRLTYVAADYIRHLTAEKQGILPSSLQWTEFCRWAAVEKPFAFPMLAGLPEMERTRPVTAVNTRLLNSRERESEQYRMSYADWHRQQMNLEAERREAAVIAERRAARAATRLEMEGVVAAARSGVDNMEVLARDLSGRLRPLAFRINTPPVPSAPNLQWMADLLDDTAALHEPF